MGLITDPDAPQLQEPLQAQQLPVQDVSTQVPAEPQVPLQDAPTASPTEFSLEPPAADTGPTVFSLGTVAPTKSALTQKVDTLVYGSILDLSFPAVEAKVKSGASSEFDAMANSMIQSNVASNSDAMIIEANQNRIEALVAVKSIQDYVETTGTLQKFLPPSVVALLTSEDPVLKDYAVRKAGKFFLAQKLMADRMAVATESQDSFFTRNGDFLDYVASSPLNLFHVKKNREYADRLTKLMYLDLPTETFTKEFNGILAEMSDEGLFTQDNLYYLQDFYNLASAGTESSVADWQGFIAAFDTLTILGLPALKAVGSVTSKVAEVGLIKTTTGAALTGAGLTATAATGAGLVAVAFGKGTAGVVRAIATDTARLVGYKTSDPKLVQKILTEAIEKDAPVGSALNLGNHTSVSSITTDITRNEYWSHTSSAAMRAWEDTSVALADAKRILNTSAKSLDPIKLEALKVSLVERRTAAARASGETRLLDTTVNVDFNENIFFTEQFGTLGGSVFVGPNGRRAAQNMADDIGGVVVQAERPNTFVVEKTSNVPTNAIDMSIKDMYLWRTTDPSQLGDGFIVKIFGSTTLQTTPTLNAILKQGESSHELWSKGQRSVLIKLERANTRSEVAQIERVFESLNKGENSSNRVGLTSQTFKDVFRQVNQVAPKDAQVAYFLTLQDHLYVDAMFKADRVFKGMVNKRIVVIEGTEGYKVIPELAGDISKVTPNAMVYSDDLGKAVKVSDLPEGKVVFRNVTEGGIDFPENLQYMTGSKVTTRRLFHSDVLALNSGGPRYYRPFEIKYYIKQARTKVFGDGTEKAANPLTVMAVRTFKEAAEAVSNLNAIVKGIEAQLGRVAGTKAEYLEAVRGLKGVSGVEELIVANSKWFPDVHSVEGLVKWADDAGVDLRTTFEHVEDGARLIGDGDGLFTGSTYGDYVQYQASHPRSRGNSVLMGFGGRENRTVPQLKSISKSLASGLAANSERAYISAAINGLLKSAIEHGVIKNMAELKGMSLENKLRRLDIRADKGIGTKLRLEQSKILERMNGRTALDHLWNSQMNNLSDFLYGKNMLGAADRIEAMGSVNPAAALRGFAFDRYLGMFNWQQLWVQGSQVINISLISTQGLKGTALYGPVRWAIVKDDAIFTKYLGDILAKTTGMEADVFVDMVEHLRSSGRAVVGSSHSNLGQEATTASYLGSRIGEVRETGRVFFKEGELVARISSHNAAFMEYKLLFPKAKTNTTEARRWIAQRDDVLTQSMTSKSKSSFEKQVPMAQFLSYTIRINEALFAGTFGGKKVLTDAERLRLAVGHTAIFGMSTWAPTELLLNLYQHWWGQESDSATLHTIRSGLLDALLTEISGTQTDVASRIGRGDGLFQLTKTLFEQNAATALGGASLQTATDTFGLFLNLAYHVGTGDVKAITNEDTIRFVRMFSSGNAAYNGYIAFKYGEKLSKDNALLNDHLTTSEAVLGLFGVPLSEETNAWRYITTNKISKAMYAATADQVTKAYNSWAFEVRQGNFDEASAIARAIGVRYSIMSPVEAAAVDRLVFKPNGMSMVDNIAVQAAKNKSGFGPTNK